MIVQISRSIFLACYHEVWQVCVLVSVSQQDCGVVVLVWFWSCQHVVLAPSSISIWGLWRQMFEQYKFTTFIATLYVRSRLLPRRYLGSSGPCRRGFLDGFSTVFWLIRWCLLLHAVQLSSFTIVMRVRAECEIRRKFVLSTSPPVRHPDSLSETSSYRWPVYISSYRDWQSGLFVLVPVSERFNCPGTQNIWSMFPFSYTNRITLTSARLNRYDVDVISASVKVIVKVLWV